MRKEWLFVIVGILLVVGVIAESNGTNNGNVTNGTNNGNGADLGDNETEQNQTGKGGAIINKTKTRVSKENITFVPWQKRNESECMEGCTCRGAVVTCPTETGRVMTITAGRSGNIITITMEKVSVNTSLELEQEMDQERNQTRLKAKLSNGIKAEVKIMPDTASERALERLRLRVCGEENNCSIELKEISEKNQLTYELQAERHSRLLWLFRKKMKVKAQVDAETGEIIRVKKPWWAFLASEPEE